MEDTGSEYPNWRGLARHLLTGLAVISFVWVVRKVQDDKEQSLTVVESRKSTPREDSRKRCEQQD